MSQTSTTTAPSNGASAATSAEPPAPSRPNRLRRIALPLGMVLLLALAGVAFNIWWQAEHYVSTDNAQVAGQPVPVGSMNAGRVVSVRATVGARVRQGDVLAQLELPSAVRTLQNGTPDLEFLGTSDQFTDVKSPMDGVVVAVPAAAGQTVSQGQPLVTLLDPSRLWVTANIDENQVSRLAVGQAAQVHLDALNADVPGVVKDLTPATAGAFALLPQSNTTTNFTKVAQVVPVRIAVQLAANPGLLGSSAEVKVRVA